MTLLFDSVKIKIGENFQSIRHETRIPSTTLFIQSHLYQSCEEVRKFVKDHIHEHRSIVMASNEHDTTDNELFLCSEKQIVGLNLYSHQLVIYKQCDKLLFETHFTFVSSRLRDERVCTAFEHFVASNVSDILIRQTDNYNVYFVLATALKVEDVADHLSCIILSQGVQIDLRKFFGYRLTKIGFNFEANNHNYYLKFCLDRF